MSLTVRGGRRDRGAGAIEYAALLALAAALVGVIWASGLFPLMPDKVHLALCEIFGGSNCSSSEQAQPVKPALSSCMVNSASTVHTSGEQILFYSHSDTDTQGLTVNGNHTITESFGGGSGDGFKIGLGIGGKVNGIGAGVNVGGGNMWLSNDQISITFKDAPQRAAFDQQMKDESKKLGLIGGMPSIVAAVVAKQMGIPYTTYQDSGQQGSLTAGGNFGPAGISGGYSDKNLVGSSVNSDGTVTKYYKTSQTTNGNAELGIEFDKLVKVGVFAAGDHQTDSIAAIKFDKDGHPVSLTITNQSQGGVTVSGSAKVNLLGGKKGPQQPPDKKTEVSNPSLGSNLKDTVTIGNFANAQHTTTTTIPLTGVPNADAIVALYADPFAMMQHQDQLRTAMAALGQAQQNAMTTVQIYQRNKGSDGLSLSASLGIDLGGYTNTTDSTNLSLTDAFYIDPKTGQAMPWIECSGGG